MVYDTITKESLEIVVQQFYTAILQDTLVGPFFIEKLGDDLGSEKWQKYLELITNFWAAMTIGDNNYHGNPFAPHIQLQGLSRETFERWLHLFFEVLDRNYTPEASELIKNRAANIAQNFMRNLGL